MKKALAAILVILLGLAAVGGYILLEHTFPVAEPIDCPNEEDVTWISLAQNNDPSISIEVSEFGMFFEGIRKAEPTRIWSVQESPAAENYYTVVVETPDRPYRFHVYAEDSRVYLESPYEGVYQTNQQLLDFLGGFFKD